MQPASYGACAFGGGNQATPQPPQLHTHYQRSKRPASHCLDQSAQKGAREVHLAGHDVQMHVQHVLDAAHPVLCAVALVVSHVVQNEVLQALHA